jgi:NADPH2:quinone reductase
MRAMEQAVVVEHTGGPEVLSLREHELPPPGPGEVRVRHTAIGVNFLDTYHRSGLYPLPSLPHGIGTEAAGVVEAVGAEVREVAVGRRVAYAGGAPGAYATARNLPARLLVPLPGGVSDEQAAAVLLKGMTVEYLVQRTFKVTRGATVLWHAAAGGVGLLACQWLADVGAVVIGTVSTDDKAARARAHGCAHAIVYTREDFVARVRELTGGEGVPVVYDAVGKDTFLRSLECLRGRGLLVSFGNASGPAPPIDPLLLSRKGSLYLTRPALFDYVASREELLASAAAVLDRVARGVLRLQVDRRARLHEVGDVHRALESRQTSGSCILLP